MRKSVFPEENGEDDAGTQPASLFMRRPDGTQRGRRFAAKPPAGAKIAGGLSNSPTAPTGVLRFCHVRTSTPVIG